MRTLLFCSLMLLIPIIAYTQEEDKNFLKFKAEFQKDFDEYQEKLQNEYAVFMDSINRTYTILIQEAENEFSDLLKDSFSEFKAMLIEKQAESGKPSRIPEYINTAKEIIYADLNEREIAFEESHDAFASPEYVCEKSPGSTIKTSLHFTGSEFSLDLDERISQMSEVIKIDPEVITDSYNFLRNTNYSIALEQLAEICRQMNLNDWDYYCLINELSKNLAENPNNQKLVAWFLLLESNFKVKIGYLKDDLNILFASTQTLYNTPWFNINSDRYYAIQYQHDSIITYDIDYFKGHKYLNIFHDKPILLEEIKKDKTIIFPYKGTTYSIPLSFNQNYVDYYSTYPMMPIEYYFALPVSLTFKESIENNIVPYLQNKSPYESLHFLLNLVQYGFYYKTDTEQFSHEKYMVPDEMLYYGIADCDDRSVFFSHLVKQLLHIDVIALDFNGHICSAVEVTDPSEKGNLIHDGKKYIVCDATYIGAIPGIILPPFQIKDAVIIDFNKKLNLYSFMKEIWNNANERGLLQAENTGNVSISKDGSIFLTGIMINDTLTEGEKGKTSEGNTSTFIARLNPQEEIQWLRQLQGCSPNFGYCISEFNDEFLYIFGYFQDTVALDNFKISAQGSGSFYLMKLDLAGKAYWLQSIHLPADSLSQGLTVVFDSLGNLKYYMPNDHFPHEHNYIMEVDENGYCYIYAMLPVSGSGMEISRYYAEGGDFDIISYLINGNDNLVKQNYPKSVSLLYAIFQFLNNNGSVIQGSSLLKTMATVYGNLVNDFPDRYSEIDKISEIGNTDGIAWIKTIDKQPVTINHLQAQHESRLKLSYVNGNAKIDVLNGIRIGGNQIWNDVNYILLDKTTGEIKYDYDNQYRKKMPVHSQLL